MERVGVYLCDTHTHTQRTIMKGGFGATIRFHSPQFFCLSEVTVGVSYFLGSPVSEKIRVSLWGEPDRKPLEIDIISLS